MPDVRRQMQVGFVVVPAALGIHLLAMLLIANHFGPQRWGVFAVVLGLMHVANFTSEMGLGTIITKLVAEAKQPPGHYIALALPLVIGVASVVAVIEVGVVCLAYSPSLVGGAALVTAVNILLFGTSLVLSCTVRGLGRIGQWQVGFVGQKVVLLAMVLAVLRPFGGGLATGMFAWTVANACTLLYYVACVWGREWHGQIRWNSGEAKKLIVEAIPVGLISVTTQLALHLDTFVVAALAGRSAAGVYAISQRLLNPARNVVLGAVITPTFPGLCRLWQRGMRTVVSSDDQVPALGGGDHGHGTGEFARQTTRLMFIQWLAGLTMSVAAFVLAPWVIPLLLTEEFNDSIKVLQITAWALPPMFLAIMFRYMYIAMSQQRRFLRLNVIHVVLRAALLILLTTRYGIAGACYAAVTVEAVMAAVIALHAASLGVRLKLAWRIAAPAACTIMLVWALWQIGTDHWLSLLPASAYVIAAGIFLNRLVKRVHKGEMDEGSVPGPDNSSTTIADEIPPGPNG